MTPPGFSSASVARIGRERNPGGGAVGTASSSGDFAAARPEPAARLDGAVREFKMKRRDFRRCSREGSMMLDVNELLLITRGDNMKKSIAAGLALAAVFAALGEVHAYVNYPWCVVGDTRGVDCVFSTKEQCAQDGRGRGFGTQCIRNPSYNPKLPSVVEQGPRGAPAQAGPIVPDVTGHLPRRY
jgi:hypothetical protein